MSIDYTVRDSLLAAINSADIIMDRYMQVLRIFGSVLHSSEDEDSHTSPTSVSPSSDVEFVGVQGALLQIQGIDKERIFTVRKLHRVSEPDPVAVLTRYFSMFGTVSKIILLPSRRRCGRMRNSTTGFVIFETTEVVQRVLKSSIHQVSSLSNVEVSRFEFPNYFQ